MPCKKIGSLDQYTEDGIDALSQADRNKLNLESLISECSANIDAGLQPDEPNANRWDYFICVRRKRLHTPIYVEVHAVSFEEVPLLLRKLAWLREKIQSSGWPEASGVPFIVAGSNSMPPNSPQYRQLAEHRIAVVTKGTQINSLI